MRGKRVRWYCIGCLVVVLLLTPGLALGQQQYRPAQLLGTWQVQAPQGTYTLVLNPDGKGTLNGNMIHWAFNQGILVMVGPGGELTYKVSITADSLTLSGGNLQTPVSWKRAGTGGASQTSGSGGLTGLGGPSATPSSGASGPVGTWEFRSPQGTASMAFKADGTGTFNGEQGKWTYNNGILSIKGVSGSTFMYKASLTSTSFDDFRSKLASPPNLPASA